MVSDMVCWGYLFLFQLKVIRFFLVRLISISVCCVEGCIRTEEKSSKECVAQGIIETHVLNMIIHLYVSIIHIVSLLHLQELYLQELINQSLHGATVLFFVNVHND